MSRCFPFVYFFFFFFIKQRAKQLNLRLEAERNVKAEALASLALFNSAPAFPPAARTATAQRSAVPRYLQGVTLALEAVAQLVVIGQDPLQLRGQLLPAASGGGRRPGHEQVDAVLQDLHLHLLLQHVVLGPLSEETVNAAEDGLAFTQCFPRSKNQSLK